MNTQSSDRSEAFALFTQAAERYCLGLSNSAMRSYALKYLTFLQARAQGAMQEEPRNGRAMTRETSYGAINCVRAIWQA